MYAYVRSIPRVRLEYSYAYYRLDLGHFIPYSTTMLTGPAALASPFTGREGGTMKLTNFFLSSSSSSSSSSLASFDVVTFLLHLTGYNLPWLCRPSRSNRQLLLSI